MIRTKFERHSNIHNWNSLEPIISDRRHSMIIQRTARWLNLAGIWLQFGPVSLDKSNSSTGDARNDLIMHTASRSPLWLFSSLLYSFRFHYSSRVSMGCFLCLYRCTIRSPGVMKRIIGLCLGSFLVHVLFSWRTPSVAKTMDHSALIHPAGGQEASFALFSCPYSSWILLRPFPWY